MSDFTNPSEDPNAGLNHLLNALRCLKEVNNLALELLPQVEADAANVTSNFLVPYL